VIVAASPAQPHESSSPISADVTAPTPPPPCSAGIANRTVFKRPGEPQDIANAIAFLCSDLAGYVTGIELNVSGGVELFVF
jgi:NAD(P)-dependent dehydrogenase (short-subunit alcohol dehydrogenase family)